MIDTSALPLPKGDRKAQKAKRDALRRKVDRAENAKVRERSGGRCEVDTKVFGYPDFVSPCWDVATEIHHMIGGGSRAKGQSLLAEHKQHVCHRCHSLITGEVGQRLVRVGGVVPMWTDTYKLVKA